jgi:glycine/D-amino acid oxidase-like deaminating enzyme
MKTVVIGNGILGLTTALRLVMKSPNIELHVIGSETHRGCASLAAAAMLNSFCEVRPQTLHHPVEKQKFLLSRGAAALWPNFLELIAQGSGQSVNHGFGTFVIDNRSNDRQEDENFLAIIDALESYSEPFEFIEPRLISKYNPSPQFLATRAIFIPGEGYINPVMLIAALKSLLVSYKNVKFINQNCRRLNLRSGKILSVQLEDSTEISGDIFVMSPGANFSQLIAQSDLPILMPRILYGVGCSLLVKTSEDTVEQCIRTPNPGKDCGLYVVPFDSEHIVVGASNVLSSEPEDHVQLSAVRSLLGSAIDQINTRYSHSQLVRVNVGWRPTSTDTLPLIGTTSIPNLLVATGTMRDGLHCSPLISDIVSDLVLTGQTNFDISLFAPERDLTADPLSPKVIPLAASTLDRYACWQTNRLET